LRTRSGFDHSTLHDHIATKQDLIEAIADYTAGQFCSTMPSNADPGGWLHGHLAGLRELMLTRPVLFTVTAELDLRACRVPRLGPSTWALTPDLGHAESGHGRGNEMIHDHGPQELHGGVPASGC
jgi:hypothetical protein